ncbi:MAG: nucleotidyltransferase family protein [Oscillospiraceae bacterium]|nr:nucleotidyltransferase family protein [Oscillospiraceae bacterium]
MVAIVLAAGYATRLYPLTLNRPKALLKIGNKTMLDHIIDEINTIGEVRSTIIVSNDKFYRNFTKWAGQKHSRTEITVLNDGTKTEEDRLGAIGDIHFVIKNCSIVDEDILVIAGDNFFTYKLIDAYNYYKSVESDCILVMQFKDREALKRLGVAVVDENDKTIGFEEKPQNPRSDLAVFATYFYIKNTLPMIQQYLDEGNKPDAPGNFVAWLCRRKDVYAYRFSGECYDIGTPEALEQVRREYGQNP